MAIVLIRRFFSVLSKTEQKILWLSLIGIAVSFVFLVGIGLRQSLVRVPTFGGEYSEALIGRAQFINPLFATTDVDRDLVRLTFSGLVKPKETDSGVTFIPDLADQIDLDAAQTLYTIRLKNDLRWQDGQPLTSADVIFTLQAIQNPDWKSPLAASVRGADIKQLDDSTLTIQLQKPYTPFIQALSVGIIPEHLWKNVLPANARLAEYNIKPIGSGPFRFSTITKDPNGLIHSYALERNQYFHSQKPYLDRITVRFYDSAELAIQAVERSEVQGLQVLPKQFRERLTRRPGLRSVLLRLPQSTNVFFNQQLLPALRDERVREALGIAVNRSMLIDVALAGEGEPVISPLLPGMLGYDTSLDSPAFDLERAGKLLDQAGYTLIDAKTYQEGLAKQAAAQTKKGTTPAENPPATETRGPANYRVKAGKALSIAITTAAQPDLTSAAEQIAAWWRDIGVDATVRTVDPKDMQNQVLANREFQALLYGQIFGNDPDPYPFWHSSQVRAPGLNLAQVSDKNIDQLLEQERTVSDNAKRVGLLQQFQQAIIKLKPAIFLYRPTYTYILPTNIHGMEQRQIVKPSDRWNSITQWYTKTKWAFK
ncbi:peptide ABC transporter substrate-binding protein [Candidatus Uhrbacteria bacterium]|nr:peptide ABC transporter substrate-binding protein [Candidatus Uhrbacteria bacterium]